MNWPSFRTSAPEAGASSVQRGKLRKMRPLAEQATPVVWWGKAAGSLRRKERARELGFGRMNHCGLWVESEGLLSPREEAFA